MANSYIPFAERFAAQWTGEPNSGCWLWLGTVHYKTGYGTIRRFNRTEYAHRASWLMHKGPIPAGMCVLHRCDVRSCANPDHLFLGTKNDNTRDMIAKGRHWWFQKDTCKNGHPFSHRNAKQRFCRICHRASDQRRRKQKKENTPHG